MVVFIKYYFLKNIDYRIGTTNFLDYKINYENPYRWYCL